MILASKIAGYVALLVLLSYGSNAACKWVLRWSATKPPESGEKIKLRGGRVTVLIFVELIASSWEILAGVVALKTVARDCSPRSFSCSAIALGLDAEYGLRRSKRSCLEVSRSS